MTGGVNIADNMDRRFTRRVEPKIFQRLLPNLQAKGAPKMCYVVSSDEDLDGQELPLAEALTIVEAEASRHARTT